MTNEEAIKYGAEWDAAIAERGDDARSDARTFIRMAIEALREKDEREKEKAAWEHWRERGY